MIGLFNRFLNTWAARAFFGILLVSLVAWGIGDMLRGIGRGGGLAQVGGQTISDQAFATEYRQKLAELRHMEGAGATPTAEMRSTIANQVIERMVTEAALTDEVARLGLKVPDSVLRSATYAIPAFKGPDGQFDRVRFDSLLRANGYTEPAFFDSLREDLGQHQLIDAIRAGVSPPSVMTDALFAYQGEHRIAGLAALPFAAAATPPDPDPVTLRRFYENNPGTYTSPEYRKIKLVILSPETIARTLDVPDAELHTAYDQRKTTFNKPEQRSLQVIMTHDAAAAGKLATLWRRTGDWSEVAARAKAADASSVSIADATVAQIPSPDLARAAFAASADQIIGPVQSGEDWLVFRVTKLTPATHQSFNEARDALRSELATNKAADAIYDRAEKVEDALSSGSGLDDLPGDLGLAAATGTVDAQGLTPEGEPAPIPASPALRAAILEAAFTAKPNASPELKQVPGAKGTPSSYYAVTVTNITSPARKPFASVAGQVHDDWMREARRHEQEQVAARLITAMKTGTSLADAARGAGVPETTSPPVPRPTRGAAEARTPGVPASLARLLFVMKPNEGTMVEVADGFVVAQLQAVQTPKAATATTAYTRTHDELANALGNDVELTYVAALRDRAHATVNRARLGDLVQQPDG